MVVIDFKQVVIDYTNYKGERRKRIVTPVRLFYVQKGQNEWHKDAQWIMVAIDQQSNTPKDFAMKNIHSWQPLELYEDEEPNINPPCTHERALEVLQNLQRTLFYGRATVSEQRMAANAIAYLKKGV